MVPNEDRLRHLERLNGLRESGALSQQEFEDEKRLVLGVGGSPLPEASRRRRYLYAIAGLFVMVSISIAVAAFDQSQELAEALPNQPAELTDSPVAIAPQPEPVPRPLVAPPRPAATPSSKASKKWLIGGWVPVKEDCAGDAGISYKANGTWNLFDSSGFWKLQGDNLVTVVEERMNDAGDFESIESPKSSVEKFTVIEPKAYQSIGEDGSKYHNVKCSS